MQSRRISRLLSLKWLNPVILPDREELQGWWETLIRSGYPDVDTVPNIIRIRSKRRQWQYIPAASGDMSYIIADVSLVGVVADLELILKAGQPNPLSCYVLLHALMADAFRHENNLHLYLFCVLKALEHADLLAEVRRHSRQQPGFSFGMVVMLMHEMAHAAFSLGHPLSDEWRGLSRVVLSKLSTHFSKLLTGEIELSPGDFQDSQSYEELERDRIDHQLKSYLGAIEHSHTLDEEVACDVLATLAVLCAHTGNQVSRTHIPAELPISARELGDLFYRAISILELTQYIYAVEQYCENLCKKVPAHDLSTTILELTARSNALVYMLNILHENVLLGTKLVPNAPPLDTLSIADQISLFLPSLARHQRVVYDTLYRPFEAITELFSDNNALDEEVEHTLSAVYPERAADSFMRDEIDALRSRIPL